MSRTHGFRLALACLLWQCWPAGAQDAAPPEVLRFSTAEFVQTGERRHPDAGAPWQQVSLPDSWNRNARERERIGWYRIRFQLPKAPRSPQAIYIPRVTNNVAVHVNDVFLGVSGNLEQRELSWNLAQWFIVPPKLLKDGQNELLLRLHPDGMLRAGLSEVHFGDEATLRAPYENRLLLQSTAPKFIATLLGLTALLSAALWASRRQEVVFGYFALLCAATIVRLWHTLTRAPDSLGWLFAAPSLTWMMAAQTMFVLRFCGQSAPRFERFMLAYAVLASLAQIFVPSGPVILGVFLVNVPVSLAMLVVLGRALTRLPSLENLTMLAAVLVNFALAIHDLVNYQERLAFDTLYLLPLGGPLLLFAVSVLLVRRFVSVLEQQEHLHAQLARRVEERERELTHSYERLRVLDQQRATAEERQRLMRDMHDGVGSHLMSTLALAKLGNLSQQQLQDVLADCIDELKITIDSLEPVESDLLVVLGNLRYRLEPRLNAAGISLEWAVNDLPPLAYLDPENVRSILRIVQEAFTNTLKHSGASRITLSTAVDVSNARVIVRVTDNGKGVKPGGVSGRGLDNMRQRAMTLNGEVEIVGLKGGGTCVNLYLPLAKIA